MQTIEYDILTLDIVLGIIGGLSGLIWQFSGLFMSDYEDFKKNMSILKSFYTIDKNTMDQNYVQEKINRNLIGEEGPHDTLINNIKKRLDLNIEYRYGYGSFVCARLISCFNCCCYQTSCAQKRLKRYELHEEGVQRMNDELDIVGLIRTLRKSQFMANTYLKEYQRFFISKFRYYHLSANEDWNKQV